MTERFPIQQYFSASCDSHKEYNGVVTVIRRLTEQEADKEVGPMYECVAGDGRKFHAFGDELLAGPEAACAKIAGLS